MAEDTVYGIKENKSLVPIETGGSGTQVTVGTYTGDGQSVRTIDLGYKPNNIFIFTVEKPFCTMGGTGTYIQSYAAVASGAYNSAGVYLVDNGFMVQQATGGTPPDGIKRNMNETSKTYVYFIW